MEDEKLKRINVFLANQGKSCDTLPKSQVQYLLKIDDAIQSRKDKIKSAEATLKEQSINVLNIASDTKIARKTFYNNELLRLYVEFCASEVNVAQLENKEIIRNLQSKNSDLESELQTLLSRDIETALLRKELAATQRELSFFIKAHEDLEHKYEMLLSNKERMASKSTGKILLPKDGKLGSFY